LCLYCLGSVAEAVGMLMGLTGNAAQITPRSVAYLCFFVPAAAGYTVLAVSFSRRSGVGRREALVGMIGAPVVLAILLVAIPLLLVWVGIMPTDS
jgi:hypothetical protein